MVIKAQREQSKKGIANLGKKKKVKEEEEVKELSPRGQKYQDLYQDIFNINMKILDMGNDIDTIEKRSLTLQKESGAAPAPPQKEDLLNINV